MSTSPLRETVINEILRKIHNNMIKKEEIITEAQICDELDVSRTPAREALIELVANGVLQKVPRKGYMIHEIDQDNKVNIYNILSALDALAASLSIAFLNANEINHMNEIVDQIDIAIKYKNYSNYCNLQEQFHSIYIERCGNPQLIKMIHDLKASISRYTYFSDDTEHLFEICKESNEEHRIIISLFEAKEAIQLETFLKNTHWRTKYLDMI